MSDLQTAAQQALEAMRRAVPTGKITLYEWDKAVSDLDAALAQEQPNPPGCDHCNHPLYAATKCRVCGRVTEQAEPVAIVAEAATTQQQIEQTPPSEYRRSYLDGYFDGFAIGKREGRIEAEDAAKQAEPVEPVYLEVCCDAHPKWMRVDEQQFDEYVANGWKGRRLYTAPPQRKED